MIHYHLNPRILTKHFISNRLFTSEVCFSLPCVSCICGVTFDLNNALVTAGAPVSEPLARAGSLYTKVAVIWPIIFNWIITWLSLFYNAHKQNTFNIALSRDKKCGLFFAQLTRITSVYFIKCERTTSVSRVTIGDVGERVTLQVPFIRSNGSALTHPRFKWCRKEGLTLRG